MFAPDKESATGHLIIYYQEHIYYLKKSWDTQFLHMKLWNLKVRKTRCHTIYLPTHGRYQLLFLLVSSR